MIECVFSASLETIRRSLRSRNSFAQSPTSETWQLAHVDLRIKVDGVLVELKVLIIAVLDRDRQLFADTVDRLGCDVT